MQSSEMNRTAKSFFSVVFDTIRSVQKEARPTTESGMRPKNKLAMNMLPNETIQDLEAISRMTTVRISKDARDSRSMIEHVILFDRWMKAMIMPSNGISAKERYKAGINIPQEGGFIVHFPLCGP